VLSSTSSSSQQVSGCDCEARDCHELCVATIEGVGHSSAEEWQPTSRAQSATISLSHHSMADHPALLVSLRPLSLTLTDCHEVLHRINRHHTPAAHAIQTHAGMFDAHKPARYNA